MSNFHSSSKKYVIFAILQFILVLLYSFIAPLFMIDGSNLCYVIPASASVLGIALGFYFNKAKMENLSKQKIRYAYLKMLLEDKLTQEQYIEIEEELENIDIAIQNKLDNSLADSIDEEINNNI